jgi:ribonuclease Z
VEACRGADALVIESTYLEEEAEMAEKFSHLTAKQAAGLALEAGVSKLYLTHVSRRYRDKEIVHEAQSVFPKTVLAHDLENFHIRREG